MKTITPFKNCQTEFLVSYVEMFKINCCAVNKM